MKVELTATFKKKLQKLDKQVIIQILQTLNDVESLENPRLKGKALKGNLSGIWRYISGDYRIFCRINDSMLTVFAIEVGHRKEIYE